MCLVLFYCERGDKMAIVPQPAFLPSAFAALGDKNIIPASNDGTGGLASMALGFPPITQQPLAEGGLPPQRGDFNGIFNLITQFLMYMQAGGVFGYAETIDYQPPSVIWADNNLYKCKKSNGPNTANGVQPITNTEYWELVSTPISVTENGGKITITQGEGAGTSFYAAINLIERNKAYTVGDIAYSPNLPTWAYLYCVQAGTTAASEPSFASVNAMGQYITDGTVRWIVDDVRFNIPVGVPFYDTYLHDGCVKLNGATVNRADYIRPAKIATDKNLWTSSPSTEPYKYGKGNGSTTMTLPDYRNRVIQGGDNLAVISAGLPNIYGSFITVDNVAWSNGTTAFAKGAQISSDWNYGEAYCREMWFNANLCNPIYGDTPTVQPPALCLIPQIKF